MADLAPGEPILQADHQQQKTTKQLKASATMDEVRNREAVRECLKRQGAHFAMRQSRAFCIDRCASIEQRGNYVTASSSSRPTRRALQRHQPGLGGHGDVRLNPDSDACPQVAMVITDASSKWWRRAGPRRPAVGARAARHGQLENGHSWPLRSTERSAPLCCDEDEASDVLIAFMLATRAHREVADVRQLHLPGPPVHGAL